MTDTDYIIKTKKGWQRRRWDPYSRWVILPWVFKTRESALAHKRLTDLIGF